jgi:hypothetical protein
LSQNNTGAATTSHDLPLITTESAEHNGETNKKRNRNNASTEETVVPPTTQQEQSIQMEMDVETAIDNTVTSRQNHDVREDVGPPLIQ